jgi:predicted dehydrogenase
MALPAKPPVKLVIVGFGVRGRQWADAFHAVGTATLTAVVDVNPEALVGAGVPAFSRLEDALDAVPVEGVILSTPPHARSADAQLLFDHRLPVLCEKPLAETIEEAGAIVRAARVSGAPLLVGMNYRFLPVTERLRRIVLAREYGELLFSQFSYIRNRDGRRPELNSFPLTMAHPMLLEQSVHHIDLIRYAYGLEVRSVMADAWNPLSSVYKGDSCVAAVLDLEGGVRVAYLGTWTSGTNRFTFQWRSDFTDGVVVQQDMFGGLYAARRTPGQERIGPLYNTNVEPLESLDSAITRPNVEDTQLLLAHFTRVVSGEESSHTTGEDHLRTLAVLHACAESAETGRRVNVSAPDGNA